MGLEIISVLKGNGIVLEKFLEFAGNIFQLLQFLFVLDIRENVDSLDHIYLVLGTQCQTLNMSVLFRV